MGTRTRTRTVRPWRVVALLAVAAVGLTSCIEGPIDGAPNLPGIIDLSRVGYQQQEFFLSHSDATAYTPTAPLTSVAPLGDVPGMVVTMRELR